RRRAQGRDPPRHGGAAQDDEGGGVMDTDRLIAQLAGDLVPVRRLASPAVRLVWWFMVSLPAAALVAWAFGLRPGLAARLADPAFLAEEAAALLTAVLAAYAALCAGVPDQPGWKLWLPLAPMAAWLSVLGGQCLAVALRLGPEGLRITADPMCLPAVALGGLLPALAIAVLLRRGGRFRTGHGCLCGGLAAAALGAAALRLYHVQNAAAMVIVWQLGSVALFTLAAGVLGRALAARRPGRVPHART
ncbi:MAG: NrsF family protein, partial [Acetobacteraceae bacterium]